VIGLQLPYGFDTLEYSWVKATIGICMLADYSVAKKCQHNNMVDSPTSIVPLGCNRNIICSVGRDRCRCSGLISTST
jgi:hypothetical protein